MNNHLRAAEALTNLLENQFKIMGFKFGLDPIIGLIPGLGDALGALIALYLVWIGIQMSLPAEKIVAMILNIVIDFVGGSLPIIGDVVDFAFKSNSKNLEILKKYSSSVIEGQIVQ